MIIIFMGPPGAGKGTQSQTLVDKLSIIQISTGDILRKEVKDESSLGLKVKKYIDAGDLVPDQLIIDIIDNRIVQDDCRNGFILDGFPRTIEQGEALKNMLLKHNKKMDHAVYFDVPDKELIVRLLKRSEIEGRADDNLEAIKNRLEVFKEKTEPLLEYYKSNGLLRFIDGTGTTQDVTERLLKALEV